MDDVGEAGSAHAVHGHIDVVDHLAREVVAVATAYPAGYVVPGHRHRRAQVLYGATGTMRVEVAEGAWTVPADRAVLVPPAVEHSVLMDGVRTRSLYLEPRAVPWFPPCCVVVGVSPLLRELLAAAVDGPAGAGAGAGVGVGGEPAASGESDRPPGAAPADRARDAALDALLLHELRRAAPLPLDLPLPADPALRALCREFLDSPRLDATPQAWASRLGVGVRTLHRRFVAETGTGLAAWRRRACVLRALPDLAEGRPIAAVAADLGYASPAAFTTMFHRLLGMPPSRFRPPVRRGPSAPTP